MKCCENHNDQDLSEKISHLKKDNQSSNQTVITFTIDKFLSYILIGLILGTIIAGYYVVSNKNKIQSSNNTNVQGATQTSNDMASHHGDGETEKKFEPLAEGSIAPNFSLTSTTGQIISLTDYKGKNVLLFFNEGVMCSPCWQEISRLERYKEELSELNTVVIPISVDDQKTWDPILKEEKITTPILIDSDRKVTSLYKALGTPSSMHDDRAGHTYIHIKPDGKIHSSRDFSDMYVPVSDLIQHIKESQSSNVKTQS